MTLDEFFSEAERLNLRMLGTPEETRAALDMKDAEIARLRARVLELEAVHEDASGAVLQERERCAKLVEAMDTTGHDGYIETTGDLCEAIAARIRRA
jgi:hypothetical protein